MSGTTSGPRIQVVMTDEAKSDVPYLTPLDGSQDATEKRRRLVKAIVEVTKSIEDHPWVGDPLREDGEAVGIGGYRKVPFDPDGNTPPELRLVYELVPDGEHPRKARVIAIGRRRLLAVYKLAAKRGKK